MEKLDGLSMNVEQAEREKLQSVFPQCFVDGKLDIDRLLNLCGEYITDDFEKYEFRWNGKSECVQLAGQRSTGTLRPCVDESVDFDTTKNVYIEGDNLEVLKLLQTSYYRKVKMIYIDPPYNTGNDFVYNDDFKDPMARYKEVTSQTTKSNPETMGRFHTNWLNMMYPRLRLAANLLRDDGVIFISIDDNEVHNLRKLCDEVFGEENFEGQIHWRRRHNQPNDKTKMIGLVAEHILAYSKNKEFLKSTGVGKIDLTGNFSNPDNDPRGSWASKPWKVGSDQSGSKYQIVTPTGNVLVGDWMGEERTYKELLADNRIIFPRGGDGMPRKKYFKYEREEEGQCATNWWEHQQFGHNQGANDCLTKLLEFKNIFSNPKPAELIRGLIQISNARDNDIILDFFSGSATTAHAVMQLNKEASGNRRFILVQLPEPCDEKSEAYKAGYKNICEIGKERIRRAGKKLAETNEQIELDNEATALDTGFKVFKLDTSNLKIWDNTPIFGGDLTELERRLRGMLDIMKDDRSNLDIVYEVMLKLGQDLCEDIIEIDINGKTVYGIGVECTFIVCLAEHITVEDADEMTEYAPGRIIFTDQCFDNSTDKSNVKLCLRNKGITIKML